MSQRLEGEHDYGQSAFHVARAGTCKPIAFPAARLEWMAGGKDGVEMAEKVYGRTVTAASEDMMGAPAFVLDGLVRAEERTRPLEDHAGHALHSIDVVGVAVDAAEVLHEPELFIGPALDVIEYLLLHGFIHRAARLRIRIHRRPRS